jgi:hypothetical protein
MANNSEEQLRELKTFVPTYRTQWKYPAGARAATIYLHGLLSLCFDGEQECTVGVNKQPSHTPKLGIWDKKNCETVYELSPDGSEVIKIEILDSSGAPKNGVYVYAPELAPPPPPTPPTDRFSYVKYSLDLESEKFHAARLEKVDSVLLPRFIINNGFFCAYKPTVSKFALLHNGVERHIGNIALAITADLFLDPNDVIRVVNGPTTLWKQVWKTGMEFEIAITNACTDSTSCVFNPSSKIPEERNDFYLHYKATTVDASDQFQLVNEMPGGSPDPIRLGVCIAAQQGSNGGYYQPFSDPAPCAPIGFGMTNKLL